MKRRLRSVTALLLPLAMIMDAAALMRWAFGEDAAGQRAKNWPSVPGLAIYSHGFPGGRNLSPQMSVRYRYQVGQAWFEGERLNFGNPSPTAARTARFSQSACAGFLRSVPSRRRVPRTRLRFAQHLFERRFWRGVFAHWSAAFAEALRSDFASWLELLKLANLEL